MSGVATAVVAGSVFSGYMGSKAAKRSANAQVQAAAIQADESQRQFDLTRADTKYQRELGEKGLRSAGDMILSGDPSAELAKTPGYRFRLSEMEKALQRRQAASGNRFSGKALREATRYGQDFASNEFDRALDRRFRLAGYGTSGINTAANAGAQNAAAQGLAAMNAGRAIAQGAIGQASAWNNAIQGGLSNYMTLQTMNQYRTPYGPQVRGDAYMPAARYG